MEVDVLLGYGLVLGDACCVHDACALLCRQQGCTANAYYMACDNCSQMCWNGGIRSGFRG